MFRLVGAQLQLLFVFLLHKIQTGQVKMTHDANKEIKKQQKNIKILCEIWYRTRVLAVQTKPLYPLGYRAFNTKLCAITLNLFIQY